MAGRIKPTSDDLVSIWNAALKAKIGLAISTSDRKLLRQQLYNCRKAMGKIELEDFSIHTPEDPNELWIINRPNAMVKT